jgi:hypothetical protein
MKASRDNVTPPFSQSALKPQFLESLPHQESSPPFKLKDCLSESNRASFSVDADALRQEARSQVDSNRISSEASEPLAKNQTQQKKTFKIVIKDKSFPQLTPVQASPHRHHKPYLFHVKEVATPSRGTTQPTEPTCLQEEDCGSCREKRACEDPAKVAAPTVLRRRLHKESDNAQSGVFGNLQDYESFIRRMSSKMIISRQKKNNLLGGSKDSGRIRVSKTLKEAQTLPLADSPDVPSMTAKYTAALSSCRKVKTGEFRLHSNLGKKKQEVLSTFSREQDSPVRLDGVKTDRPLSKGTEALKKKLSIMVRGGMQQDFRAGTPAIDEQSWEEAPVLPGDFLFRKAHSPLTAEPKHFLPRAHMTARESHPPRLQPHIPGSAADLSTILNLLQTSTAVRPKGQ